MYELVQGDIISSIEALQFLPNSLNCWFNKEKKKLLENDLFMEHDVTRLDDIF